jgi:hypothetical protein
MAASDFTAWLARMGWSDSEAARRLGCGRNSIRFPQSAIPQPPTRDRPLATPPPGEMDRGNGERSAGEQPDQHRADHAANGSNTSEKSVCDQPDLGVGHGISPCPQMACTAETSCHPPQRPALPPRRLWLS